MVLVTEPISNLASGGRPSVVTITGPSGPSAATATTMPSPRNAPSTAPSTARALSLSPAHRLN
ncbi:MAG TPA: hypothetical protein VIL16_14845 [Trebonia sp.]